MSSAVVSTSAALGRPFVFDDECTAEAHSLSSAKKPAGMESNLAQIVHSTIKNQHSTIPLITPASQLEIRPAPEMASSGIPALDALTGGLPRGCLTEICGPASSGRTAVLLAALAAATRRGEYCVVVDASDALDPQSAAAASVDLDHLLWVRCGEEGSQKKNSPQRHPSASLRACPEPAEGASAVTEEQKNKQSSSQVSFNFDQTRSHAAEHRLEQVLRATDLLLESGGFGLIVLDLADIPWHAARRIPLTTWFRFRRAVEYKHTILLAIEQQPIAGSCSSLLLQLGVPGTQYQVPSSIDRRTDRRRIVPEGVKPCHAHLLAGLEIKVELICSRLERKPASSVIFETRTAWAG